MDVGPSRDGGGCAIGSGCGGCRYSRAGIGVLRPVSIISLVVVVVVAVNPDVVVLARDCNWCSLCSEVVERFSGSTGVVGRSVGLGESTTVGGLWLLLLWMLIGTLLLLLLLVGMLLMPPAWTTAVVADVTAVVVELV